MLLYMSYTEALHEAERAERFLGETTSYHENGPHLAPVDYLTELHIEAMRLHAVAATQITNLGSQS